MKDASEGGDDVAFEKTSQQSVTLYRYEIQAFIILYSEINKEII